MKRFAIIFSVLAVLGVFCLGTLAFVLQFIPEPIETPTPTSVDSIPQATATPLVPPTVTATSDPFCVGTITCGTFNDGRLPPSWNSSYYPGTNIKLENGEMEISNPSTSPFGGVTYVGRIPVTKIGSAEAKLMKISGVGSVSLGYVAPELDWWVVCSIITPPGKTTTSVSCGTSDEFYISGGEVKLNEWYTIGFQVNPSTAVITFLLDGKELGSYQYPYSEEFKSMEGFPELQVHSDDNGIVIGKFDEVRIQP